MQLYPFLRRQLVVDHDNLNFGTIRQIGGFVHDDSTVLHLYFQRLH